MPPSLTLRHRWPIADQIEYLRRQRATAATEAPLSPLAWALAYGQLAHPILGRLRFDAVIRDYQRELLESAATDERIIIVKARQIGVSQTLAFIAACEACRGGTVLVVSRNGDQAKLFLQYVYTALLDAPHPPYARENQQTLEFVGGGAVYAQAAGRGAGRGIAASLVILDEMAWQEYGDDIFIAVMPTLSNGGKAILCSTPHGRVNRFYELWAGGGDAWRRFELKWDRREDWRDDPTWAEAKRDEIGREAFAQEYDTNFAVSGGAVFDQADIDAFFSLDVLADPIGNHRYLSAWDIGRHNDATVGVTFDLSVRPYRLVAYERLRQSPFPDQQAAIEARHKAYRGRTLVEGNNQGDAVIENLSVRVEAYETTAKSKRLMIDALQLLLQRRAIAAPPIPQMARELTTYQRNDEHLVQDCVMALAIAATQLAATRAVAPAVLLPHTSTWH